MTSSAENRVFSKISGSGTKLTVVPVFALFGRAGGAWNAMDKVDVSEMEAAVGVGLRLGMSKSVNGVVNHLDVSWPVNGTLADGFAGARISLLAHTSL